MDLLLPLDRAGPAGSHCFLSLCYSELTGVSNFFSALLTLSQKGEKVRAPILLHYSFKQHGLLVIVQHDAGRYSKLRSGSSFVNQATFVQMSLYGRNHVPLTF